MIDITITQLKLAYFVRKTSHKWLFW